jgi:hypothetical protein
LPLRGSGCRNLALPGVYEQASTLFLNSYLDFLFAELDAHNIPMLSCSGEVSRYARISRGAEPTAERLGQLAELALQRKLRASPLLHIFGPGGSMRPERHGEFPHRKS